MSEPPVKEVGNGVKVVHVLVKFLQDFRLKRWIKAAVACLAILTPFLLLAVLAISGIWVWSPPKRTGSAQLLAYVEKTLERDDEIRQQLSRIEQRRQWDLLDVPPNPDPPSPGSGYRVTRQVPVAISKTLPDGRVVRCTICKPVYETRFPTSAADRLPPQFECGWTGRMSTGAVLQGRIAFNQALAGNCLEALQTTAGIEDDWAKGHILAYHVLPLFSEPEHYEKALPIAELVKENNDAKATALSNIAVHLESFGRHEKAVEALEKCGKAVRRIREEIESQPVPAEIPPTTPLPGPALDSDLDPSPVPDVTVPAPVDPQPSYGSRPSTTAEEPSGNTKETIPEAATEPERQYSYRLLWMTFAALTAYAFAVMKPVWEECCKLWLGPFLLYLGLADARLLTLLRVSQSESEDAPEEIKEQQ